MFSRVLLFLNHLIAGREWPSNVVAAYTRGMNNNSEGTEGTPEGHPEHIPAEQELAEIVFGPSSSELQAANQIFREGLVPAAQSIVHTAAYGSTERIKFEAAKYVVERNLGKVTEKLANKDQWQDLLADIKATSSGLGPEE